MSDVCRVRSCIRVARDGACSAHAHAREREEVIEYFTERRWTGSGTKKLARNCVVAMKDRYGVLLQNHGPTTYGESLAEAYSRSLYLEWLCRIYCEAKAIGDPGCSPKPSLTRSPEQ